MIANETSWGPSWRLAMPRLRLALGTAYAPNGAAGAELPAGAVAGAEARSAAGTGGAGDGGRDRGGCADRLDLRARSGRA